MRVVVVIPAYNEEKRIREAIRDAASQVSDIVVVDDCSRDNTSEAALEEGAHVLRHIINRGQGAAIQTGMDYAVQILEKAVQDLSSLTENTRQR